MSDVWDIMGGLAPSHLQPSTASTSSTNLPGERQRIKKMKPEWMTREVFALIANDKNECPPIVSNDFGPVCALTGGYKQAKAKLGAQKVRNWKLVPFSNAARKDGLKLCHWRRTCDQETEYQFAQFGVKVAIPTYTEVEYQQHLQSDSWSKGETDHLFALCKRFDLRFIIVHDRWDSSAYPPRSIEDLKERYYSVVNTLTVIRTPPGQEPSQLKYFDADHERRRKEQLTKLFNRTGEQVEEEQKLLDELKKIEMRKKEREKKTQDLQKLIAAADKNVSQSDTPGTNKQPGPGRPGPGRGRKRANQITIKTVGKNTEATTPNVLESIGIKFPEIKASGVTLRSNKMKLPGSVGTKKARAIETLLTELNVDLKPMPTEEISQQFNELRSDMVLLYELKMALASAEFELQTLNHQYEALAPNSVTQIISNDSSTLTTSTNPDGDASTVASPLDTPKKISEMIDVDSGPGSSVRKRKAALQQENLLKKLKKP